MGVSGFKLWLGWSGGDIPSTWTLYTPLGLCILSWHRTLASTPTAGSPKKLATATIVPLPENGAGLPVNARQVSPNELLNLLGCQASICPEKKTQHKRSATPTYMCWVFTWVHCWRLRVFLGGVFNLFCFNLYLI